MCISRLVSPCSRVSQPTVFLTKRALRFLKMCLLKHTSQALWVLALLLLNGEHLLRAKLKLLNSLLQVQTGPVTTALPTSRTLKTPVPSPKC